MSRQHQTLREIFDVENRRSKDAIEQLRKRAIERGVRPDALQTGQHSALSEHEAARRSQWPKLGKLGKATIIGALTAFVAAVTGLIAALHQAGVFAWLLD